MPGASILERSEKAALLFPFCWTMGFVGVGGFFFLIQHLCTALSTEEASMLAEGMHTCWRPLLHPRLVHVDRRRWTCLRVPNDQPHLPNRLLGKGGRKGKWEGQQGLRGKILPGNGGRGGRRARLAKTAWESNPGAGQSLSAAHKPWKSLSPPFQLQPPEAVSGLLVQSERLGFWPLTGWLRRTGCLGGVWV